MEKKIQWQKKKWFMFYVPERKKKISYDILEYQIWNQQIGISLKNPVSVRLYLFALQSIVVYHE